MRESYFHEANLLGHALLVGWTSRQVITNLARNIMIICALIFHPNVYYITGQSSSWVSEVSQLIELVFINDKHESSLKTRYYKL